jgi:hypothetical protein
MKSEGLRVNVLILVNDQIEAQFFFCMFVSILCMFRATSCSSSGESIVSIHLVCVNLCRWSSSMQVGKLLPDLNTRRSPTQSDIYQMLYWYNWFSWWWARCFSKHAENWNKHIEKEFCVKLFTRICKAGPWNNFSTLQNSLKVTSEHG